MRLRLSSAAERVRTSLFFVPMTAVCLAVAGGLGTLTLDSHLEPGAELPLGISSTVESARALLGTIAGATIGFAGIAFSVSLLVIQLASSQYSPRVVHTLFRDPFNKRVMAIVVGTFTYCVIVLRSVRTPLEEGGQAVIPNLSVTIAVVLGLLAILAVVAFIDHNAHVMDVSQILDRVTSEATEQVRREWSVPDIDDAPVPGPPAVEGGAVVTFDRSGWVQQLDVDALAACGPPGVTITVEAAAGHYAVEGTALCRIADCHEVDDAVARGIRASVGIGSTRTMQQDVSYGVRQLVDVALRALSPGVNDPTTAQDAIFHVTAVLAELLRRTPPPRARARPEGGWLVLARAAGHADLVRLGFDEVRRAAADQPTVCLYVLEALHLLADSLEPGRPASEEAAEEIREQARLTLAGAEGAGLLPEDAHRIRESYRSRFGALPA